MKADVRHVRCGAAAYIVGVVQFFAAVAVTASRYGPASYNPLRDTVSDLQAVNCGIFQGNEVCSPLHLVANSSVAVLGLLFITGSVLIRTAFPAGSKRKVAVGLLVVAGLATFANAFTPEDVTLLGDLVTALVAFLCANFGLVEMGRVMSGNPRWGRLRPFTEVLGVLGLAGLIVDGASPSWPLGAGGDEWLTIAPVLVWALVVGVRLLKPEPTIHFTLQAGNG